MSAALISDFLPEPEWALSTLKHLNREYQEPCSARLAAINVKLH